MSKQTRRKLLKTIHRALTALAAATSWLAGMLDRVSTALNRAADVCDPARGAADMVELRDALTGEPLGMTKKQYRRYVLALGTEDPRVIAKAAQELQERRRRILASMATAACLLLTLQGCTRSNDARLCVPGQQMACPCPGGLQGAQACLDDGSGFTTCAGCGLQVLGPDLRNPSDPPDLAEADLVGADLTGYSPPDLVNPAFAGVTCGASNCGSTWCCAQVSSSGTVQACYPDPVQCPPSFQAAAMCDGPEDCTDAGYACFVGLTTNSSQQLTTADGRCRPTVGVMNKISGDSSTGLNIATPACHSNDDCVGIEGMTKFGVLPFSSCCHFQGLPKSFCYVAGLSGSNGVACP